MRRQLRAFTVSLNPCLLHCLLNARHAAVEAHVAIVAQEHGGQLDTKLISDTVRVYTTVLSLAKRWPVKGAQIAYDEHEATLRALQGVIDEERAKAKAKEKAKKSGRPVVQGTLNNPPSKREEG